MGRRLGSRTASTSRAVRRAAGRRASRARLRRPRCPGRCTWAGAGLHSFLTPVEEQASRPRWPCAADPAAGLDTERSVRLAARGRASMPGGASRPVHRPHAEHQRRRRQRRSPPPSSNHPAQRGVPPPTSAFRCAPSVARPAAVAARPPGATRWGPVTSLSRRQAGSRSDGGRSDAADARGRRQSGRGPLDVPTPRCSGRMGCLAVRTAARPVPHATGGASPVGARPRPS